MLLSAQLTDTNWILVSLVLIVSVCGMASYMTRQPYFFVCVCVPAPPKVLLVEVVNHVLHCQLYAYLLNHSNVPPLLEVHAACC